MPAGFERRPERVEQPLRHARRGFGIGDLRQQHRKLIAAQPRQAGDRAAAAVSGDEVARPHALFETLADRLEQDVAEPRTERLIDVLEPIQIDVQHDAAVLIAAAMLQRPAKAVEEHAPVGQPGDRVVVGEPVAKGLGGQRVAQAQRQLARVHRLGQEIRRAELERLELDSGICGGGEHDHRDQLEYRIAAHAPQNVEAAHARHDDVEQQHVRPPRCQQLERFGRFAGGNEIAVTGFLQKCLQGLDRDGFVVNHHDEPVTQRGENLVGLGGLDRDDGAAEYGRPRGPLLVVRRFDFAQRGCHDLVVLSAVVPARQRRIDAIGHFTLPSVTIGREPVELRPTRSAA